MSPISLVMEKSSFSSAVTAALIVTLLYYTGRAIYRLHLHPLSSYPGPMIRAVSDLPKAYHYCRGFDTKALTDLHETYGSVVRVAPNELSYATAGGFRDIYGLSQDRKYIPKSRGYYNTFNEPDSNVHDADAHNHPRMRRILNHAFSAQALQEQEPIISKYFDLLIAKLTAKAKSPDTNKIDIDSFYNSTTFDVLGDICFGEPFGALENDGHHWIRTIFANVRSLAVFISIADYPTIFRFILLAIKYIPAVAAAKEEHEQFTRAKIQKRAHESPEVSRKDLLHYIFQHNDEDGMNEKEIFRTADILIIAGSETTGTTLSGATYLLLTNKHCLDRVVKEIRSSFTNPQDINIKSALQLPYLRAVIDETLRYYPPVSGGLPRTTDVDMTIDGQFVPAGIRVGVAQFPTYHSPTNFRNPDTFAPERWLGDLAYKDDDKSAYQPFSTGPRNCLGRSLAYAELACILSRVFFHFDLKLSPDSHCWMDQRVFMSWEKPPLMVEISLRGGK